MNRNEDVKFAKISFSAKHTYHTTKFQASTSKAVGKIILSIIEKWKEYYEKSRNSKG